MKFQPLSIVFAAIALTNCTYRLRPLAAAPSQVRLKLIAAAPADFLVLIKDISRDYRVPADGKLTLYIPGYRGCDVYFFGIKINSRGDLDNATNVEILKGGSAMRRLSLRRLSKLPADSEGYHMIKN